MSDPSPEVDSGVQRRRAYPDEDLPEGSVIDCAELTRNLDESFDFVVVGSGASGAVAAHTLARAGHRVALVEEGPWVKTRDFTPDVLGSFRRLMRDAATQAIEGRSFIPLLQGRCVGGSTVVNSAIAWRLPSDTLEDWRTRFGLKDALNETELSSHFDALEEALNVHAIEDDVLGQNSRGLLDAASGLGVEAHKMRRYDRDCVGSGRCLQGCPSAAKQGMSVSYVPWALSLGARIFTSCKVDRVEMTGDRVSAIVGKAITRTGEHAVRIRATQGVIIAASTIQTPNILRRSGVRATALGRHFQAHPGVGCAAVFESRVQMDFGATQGAESIHYRKSEGFKLESIAMPPELLAARMPGAGTELMRRLADFPNVGIWVAQVRAEAEGTVESGFGGRDKVVYTPTARDMHVGRKALAVLARLMFAQGAKEIWPGVHGLPSVLRSVDEVKLIDEGPTDPRAYGMVASHLFGAARMGPDPKTSVVGTDFAVHGAKGLYVVDSSIFPTNLGVNPQHSIMALARLAATRIAEVRVVSRVA
ncbi:GMC family oxidoreductase [soil metagenome]